MRYRLQHWTANLPLLSSKSKGHSTEYTKLEVPDLRCRRRNGTLLIANTHTQWAHAAPHKSPLWVYKLIKPRCQQHIQRQTTTTLERLSGNHKSELIQLTRASPRTWLLARFERTRRRGLLLAGCRSVPIDVEPVPTPKIRLSYGSGLRWSWHYSPSSWRKLSFTSKWKFLNREPTTPLYTDQT